MKGSLSLRREAQNDIEEAHEWYEGRRPGLGGAFVQATRQILAEIERSPQRFRKVRGEVRQASLPRFPYSILYIAESQRIVVIACFHVRRDPQRWESRMGTGDTSR